MKANFYANIMESKGPVLGDSYFLQTKEEIEKWLKVFMKVKNYKININLTIDVDGDIDLSRKNLTKIPVKFNEVNGDFNISHNQLTSLKGSPEIIGGNFNCYMNEISSLEFCPKEIKGDINIAKNKLISLKFLPFNKNRLSFQDNNLKTLEGLNNINTNILLDLIENYPELDWKDIEWNNVKNIDKITQELYIYTIVNDNLAKESSEALKRLQELQLY